MRRHGGSCGSPSSIEGGKLPRADDASVEAGSRGLQLALRRDRLDGLDLLLLGAPAAVALGVAGDAHHAGGDRLVADDDEAADHVALLPADPLDVEPVHVHLGAGAAPGARLVVLLLGLADGLHVLGGGVDGHGSKSTPGLSRASGSSTALAARSAAANGPGRWRSYHGRWSRPTAWWWVIVPPAARIASPAAHLIACHCSSSAPRRAGATTVKYGAVPSG